MDMELIVTTMLAPDLLVRLQRLDRRQSLSKCKRMSLKYGVKYNSYLKVDSMYKYEIYCRVDGILKYSLWAQKQDI